MEVDLQCECGCAVTVRNRSLSSVRCPDCNSRISVPRASNAGRETWDEGWRDWDEDVVKRRSDSGAKIVVGIAVAVALVAGVAMVFLANVVMELGEGEPDDILMAQNIEPEPALAAKPAQVFADSLEAQKAFPREVEGPALQAFQLANQLKDRGFYPRAEQEYKRALQLEPNFPFAAYQLGCNYCRWGRPDDGWNWFQRAVDMGLWSHPLIADDFEINNIRSRPGFDELVEDVKARYQKRASEIHLPPIVMRPKDSPPEEGWPIMLVMHGYGGTPMTWVDQIETWTRQGFIAVGVTGPVAMADFWFRWPVDSVDKTHAYLADVLEDPEVTKDARMDAVFIMGFSQGAIHGFELIAQHPDVYAGLIAISPWGKPDNTAALQLPVDQKRPVVLISGRREMPETHRIVQTIEQKCRQSGWWLERRFHSGGRRLPENWHEMEPVIAQRLKERIARPQ